MGALEQFDLIICVGLEELELLSALYAHLQERIVVACVESGGIPNPWQRGPDAYRVCAEIIEHEMARIAQDLKRRWG